MRLTLFTGLLVLILPAVCHGQSDLRKIGKIIQGIQDLQKQNRGQQNRPPQNNGDKPTAVPYSGDPNMSGNQNNGNFNRPGFFQPRPGGQQQFPPGQVTYPNNSYPNGYRPGTSYPSGQVIYPGQSQTYPSTPQVVYSQQPIVIRCDSDASGTCQYELLTALGKSYPYQISGGQSQSLKENTSWAFRYKPTPTSPMKTYRLRGGKSYEVRKSGNSWQLYILP